LNDALTTYQQVDRQLQRVAHMVGITEAQWFAIKGS
jgi:hypothetical protein